MRATGLFPWIAISAAVVLSSPARAPAATLENWTERQPFVGSTGDTVHYYLFTPKGVEPGKRYPLVLWLHGGLKSNGVGGPNMPTGAFYREDHQQKHPCFVLRPVAIKGTNWVSPRGAKTGSHAQPEEPAPSMLVLLELLEETIRRNPIDTASMHVVGASMGGYGTWDLITRHPQKFASAIPICGGGDPQKAPLIKQMRIWIFHSADDGVVPVQASRDMFRALIRAKGGEEVAAEGDGTIDSSSPDGTIRYTEFDKGGHNAWDRALREPRLLRWMFGKP